MKKITLKLGLVALLLFLASCSASQKTPKKCNGKRGVNTPMGTM
jgi:hypothetical protein